jgi:hypothetical protein
VAPSSVAHWRYDCHDGMPAMYARSYALFSDDQGETWTMGELLPQGFSECQATPSTHMPHSPQVLASDATNKLTAPSGG